jgi:hypothetical protein
MLLEMANQQHTQLGLAWPGVATCKTSTDVTSLVHYAWKNQEVAFGPVLAAS